MKSYPLNTSLPLLCTIAAMAALSERSPGQASITAIRHTGASVELKLKGAAGDTYRVDRSPTMAAGTWTSTGTTLNTTGAEQTITVPTAAVGGKEFFRLAFVPASIPGFVFIPGGSFRMGDQSTSTPKEGLPNERPVIEVELSGFHLKTTEVTKDEWDAGKTYATGAGYTFTANAGDGKAGNHPVHSVNWYDVVKWCNARSEQDGLEPCYYTTSAQIYRTGQPSSVVWAFNKNGYRLPAEAEWEKAARGGLEGARFPWGFTITHSLANYRSTANYAYDESPTRGFHPTFSVPAVTPYTSPVGSFAPNGFGLYDMSGNVREYCWDSVTSNYSGGYQIKSQSSGSLTERVVRGGDWSIESVGVRCSQRSSYFPDTGKGNFLGFRPARGRIN